MASLIIADLELSSIVGHFGSTEFSIRCSDRLARVISCTYSRLCRGLRQLFIMTLGRVCVRWARVLRSFETHINVKAPVNGELEAMGSWGLRENQIHCQSAFLIKKRKHPALGNRHIYSGSPFMKQRDSVINIPAWGSFWRLLAGIIFRVVLFLPWVYTGCLLNRLYPLGKWNWVWA